MVFGYDMVRDWKIVLASLSPRRRELLSGLDLSFEVRVADGIDESYPEGLSMTEIPEFISRRKSEAYVLADDELLITADTIVWLDGVVLGKPADVAEAKRMLADLSGRTHHVVTGVTLRSLRRSHTFSSVTEVTFDTLSPEQIDYYVERYRPLDKAGAYGIQEWIGYTAVTQIRGSYFNVMGLPVQRLSVELRNFVKTL